MLWQFLLGNYWPPSAALFVEEGGTNSLQIKILCVIAKFADMQLSCNVGSVLRLGSFRFVHIETSSPVSRFSTSKSGIAVGKKS